MQGPCIFAFFYLLRSHHLYSNIFCIHYYISEEFSAVEHLSNCGCMLICLRGSLSLCFFCYLFFLIFLLLLVAAKSIDLYTDVRRKIEEQVKVGSLTYIS